ncbi:PEP/pyruvate-binding domain-containing protein [Stackebrandtia nassauensis]|uniref:Pyruvate phosphate dikinase PEP/pyruvate-binding protein n=1 Tax=Stackebrandtia nassauensis (strain DSM 44728 / CIP 108903 / NRRL B-16338 / NBRC 102104 / LLR-40K-21) TaxID=446470 RepID=D3QBF8_STANL|nr:PEP/pyruvate-binding domain-containing protein [Stackebrandtia nassauensis]ADD42840.1 pyruvate phosphate dikinase PEP/pyruvate- binding protein [Stackebrandtia nassauensis DSM 44728]
MPQHPLWLRLDAEAAATHNTGGKGASLAIMARAKLPVPQGFHVTTAAYESFTSGLNPHSIVAGIDVTDAKALAEACRTVAELLEAAPMPDAVAEAIAAGYATLSGAAVAVRSSATAEDLPEASFAGQMESYLNIVGVEAVTAAVKRCWLSLWTERAVEYRARNDIAADDVSMAVVVQELIDAEAAGVMFTANPVTGARDQIIINAAWGLGEAVVSGKVSADTITVDANSGAVVDQTIADKTVKTVRVDGGTVETDVPEDQRGLPVLDDEAAARLAALGARVVALYRQPMDIEWALADGAFTVLQARPITNLAAAPVAREEWNDSLNGDFLWTASNVAEAVPSIMTPITWSMTKNNLGAAMAIPGLGEHRVCGNIGGRLYINYSLLMGVAKALGMGSLMRKAGALAFGVPPAAAGMPRPPFSWWKTIRLVLPDARRFAAEVKHYQKNLDDYVAKFPARCDTARTAIAAATTVAELAEVWTNQCVGLGHDAPRMLAAGGRVNGNALAKLRPWLLKYVDDADANALVTGAHTTTESLASLGPLLGLRQLADGDIDADTYIARWGHRCPDEMEMYAPRPAEDPNWLDAQLAGLKDAPDVDALLARQTEAKDAAMKRFTANHPGKVAALAKRMNAATEAVRAREAARSEAVRVAWVTREFLLRLGEITGHGDDVFFCEFEEIEALLDGDDTATARVPARRATYDHYRTLPVYPTWIRGAFDPEAWAADPARRGDLAAPNAGAAARGDTVVGTAGSTGVVEGVARVVADMSQAHRIDVGDILVTKITNIGWTPVFPRLGAVVTDIGASLSHASIVARELGIPAVVGCGDATTRINDGDRVRVDGGNGTVEIVERGDVE